MICFGLSHTICSLQSEGAVEDNIRAVQAKFVLARESYVPSAGNLLYGWGAMQGLGNTWSSYDMVGFELSGAMGGISLDNGNHMCFNAYQYPWSLPRTTAVDNQLYELAFFGALEYDSTATVLLDYQPYPGTGWCTYGICVSRFTLSFIANTGLHLAF